MSVQYSAAACVLSAAAVMLVSPPLSRTGRKSGIFSASLGIILYRIVKSIIVECGWEFAASAGIRTGLAIEMLTMCCGIVLFGELEKMLPEGQNESSHLPVASVIMLSAGKGLLCDAALVPSAVEFVIGRAVGIALISSAVYITGADREPQDAQSLTVFGVVCAVGSFAAESLLGLSGCRESSPAAPLLMMLGCCGLMRGFAEGIRNAPQISPAGFAAGMFLSYGFDCLAG